MPTIQSGIEPREYWSLTLGEIEAQLEAYNRRLQFQVDLDKEISYTTATLTSQFIGLMMSKKPLPSYEECFGITSSTGNNTDIQDQKMKQYESQWIAFAYQHNRRNKNNGG